MKWLLEAKGKSQGKGTAVNCKLSTLTAVGEACAHLVQDCTGDTSSLYCTGVSLLEDQIQTPNPLLNGSVVLGKFPKFQTPQFLIYKMGVITVHITEHTLPLFKY